MITPLMIIDRLNTTTTVVKTTTVKIKIKKFFTVVVVLIIENICTVVVKVTLFGQRQI